MSTPAPIEPADPLASAPASAADNALATKLIGAWKRAYLIFKPLEARVDAARLKVAELMHASGFQLGEKLSTKHGDVCLSTKSTIDWEGMARSVVKPEFLEQLKTQFTSTSKPFVRAPHSWSGEAKR
jgi:hypothetical protein